MSDEACLGNVSIRAMSHRFALTSRAGAHHTILRFEQAKGSIWEEQLGYARGGETRVYFPAVKSDREAVLTVFVDSGRANILRPPARLPLGGPILRQWPDGRFREEIGRGEPGGSDHLWLGIPQERSKDGNLEASSCRETRSGTPGSIGRARGLRRKSLQFSTERKQQLFALAGFV